MLRISRWKLQRFRGTRWRSSSSFTHVSEDGNRPQMVDVGEKPSTRRSAWAQSIVRLPLNVLSELRQSESDSVHELVGTKGPVVATAIVAGVQAAKQTSSLIPFCHPVPIEDCKIDIHLPSNDQGSLVIDCIVRTTHKTGVEMEALTGASTAALCVYDMCKALSKDIVIESTRVLEKTGGTKGGDWKVDTDKK